MSDLVGNPEDRFSRVAAHFCIIFNFHFSTGVSQCISAQDQVRGWYPTTYLVFQQICMPLASSSCGPGKSGTLSLRMSSNLSVAIQTSKKMK